MKYVGLIAIAMTLAGCATGLQSRKVEETNPTVYLSVRSAEDYLACLKPAIDELGDLAELRSYPASGQYDVHIYAEQFDQRHEYFLIRIEAKSDVSATSFFSLGDDHGKISESDLNRELNACI